MYNDKTLKSVAEAVKQVMESELSAKQKAIAKIAEPKHKIDAGDLAALRAGKKPVKEGWDDMIKAAKEKQGPQPSGGAGKKAGHSYGGGKQKDDKPVKEEVEQIDEISLALAKRARDKAETHVDWDEDDLRNQPYGYSEKQRSKFQRYIDKKEPRAKGDRDWDPPVKKGVKEEASQEEFTAEIKKAQAKSQGKEKAEVAKPAVVAVKQESVEQIDELSKDTLTSYALKAGKALGGHVATMGLSKEIAKSALNKVDAKKLKAQHTDLARRRMFGLGNAAKRLAKEEVEQVNEKAKWRSSSAAEPNPEHDPEEYAHDKLSTGSPIRSKADKPLPYGSIQSRRGAEVASSGPRKGMITKKSAESLKNRMKANLNKEEVEQIDEAVDMTDAKSVATHLAKKAISLHGISNPNRAAHHAKNADAIEKTIDRVKRSSSPSELAKAHTEVGSVRASVRRMNVGRAMSSAEKSAHKTLQAGVVKHLEKHLDQHHAAFRNAAAKFAAKNEEVEHINERTLTAPETAEKERIVKSMKKGLAGFKQRYGERAKSVMYATATKLAKGKE